VTGEVSTGCEDAQAAWRQMDRYQIASCEAELADVSVKHEGGDRRVAAKADASQRPRVKNPPHVRGESGAR